MISIVVGGAGHIGSHLCEFLLSKNNEVFCIDNLITGDICNIESMYNDRRFTFIRQDASHYNVAKTLSEHISLRDIDNIYYLASISSADKYLKMPIETIDANIIGLKNLLEIATSNKIKFLYTSSHDIYGDALETPQKETYAGNVDIISDNAICQESKRMAETLVMSYRKKFGLNTRIARIFPTYGPRMSKNDSRVIPVFIKQAMRGDIITVHGIGTQVRSFCYVSDVVRALLLIMNSSYCYPLNIGNPEYQTTIYDLAQIIKRLTNSESEIIINYPFNCENEPKVIQPDISLIRSRTIWYPNVSLENGLSKTIQYFKEL